MVLQKILIWILIAFLIVMTTFYFYITYIFLYTVISRKAPFVSSFDRHLKLMIGKLKLQKWKTMIDLWCWSWKALRFFIKNFDLRSCEWYDFDRTAILQWKIINKIKWQKKIKLIRSKFENADLKKYDYIYLYLRPNQLDKMQNWVFSNIKKDAIVISNSFKFANKKPFEVIKNEKGVDSIFLYKN